ncbi:MAG TPA: hypothetical protein VEK39_11495 [Solirubrobacterales bacterium]|nr:hypothetical protein [Solirubrobacterales bacterium]
MSVAQKIDAGSETRLEDAVQRELAERRLSALAQAVREHEARVRAQIGGVRPHDALLHRRLRQILGA